MPNMSGVRNDAQHTLTVDRRIALGVKERRTFTCTCGESFGLQYDAPARALYRAHRKASA